MSKIAWTLRLSLLLNALLVLFIAGIFLRRYNLPGWQFIHQRFLSTMPSERLIIIGDSQLDNLHRSGLLNDYKVQSLAIPGQTSGQLLQRARSWAVDEGSHQILLQIGINDLRYGVPMDSLQKNMALLLEQVRAKFPGSEILLLSVFPILEGTRMNPGVSNEIILRFNRTQKEMADRQTLPFLNVFDLLSRQGVLNRNYSMDGLHLNLMGNQLLWKAVEGFIEQTDE